MAVDGGAYPRMLEVMRSKNFLIFLLFVLATSISLWLVSVPTPTIRTIVAETVHNKIKNIKMPGRALVADNTHLELLGFHAHPKLYAVEDGKGRKSAAGGWRRRIPVVVTGVTRKDYDNAYLLLDSIRKYFVRGRPKLVIFDLGLGSYESVELKKRCNETTGCLVRTFDYEKFPSHLKDFAVNAFKPVIIQEALNEYGAIIWTDSSEYFIMGRLEKILSTARTNGIAAWKIASDEPTSALTHPKMFKFFKVHPNAYYFQHMVDSRHLVLYNTEAIHRELMRPWVGCALKVECIFPTGAQTVGCHTQRKPKFLYSGCHHSDASALNVILGTMFPEDESYTVSEKVFGVEKKMPENTTVRDKAGGGSHRAPAGDGNRGDGVDVFNEIVGRHELRHSLGTAGARGVRATTTYSTVRTNQESGGDS